MRAWASIVLLAIGSGGCLCGDPGVRALPQPTDPPVPAGLTNAACVEDVRPALAWSASPYAVRYEVRLTPESGEAITLTTTGTNIVPPLPLAVGRWSWTVRAIGSDEGAGVTSALATFVEIGGLAPLEVVPIGTDLCEPPALSWSDPAGLEGATYDVELGAPGSATVLKSWSEATSGLVLDDGGSGSRTLAWRVRRVFAGCAGAWTSGEFAIAEAPAAPVNAASHWDGCGPWDVTLAWSGAGDAFELEVARDRGPATVVPLTTATWTSREAAPVALAWRVRAFAGTCASPWSAPSTLHPGLGTRWTSIPQVGTHLPAREGFATITNADGTRLWLAGGEAGADSNEVWTTTDAASWTLVAPNPPFHTRRWAAGAFHAGELFVLGGNENAGGTNRSDVWASADGAAWTKRADTPFAARHSPGAVSFGGRLFVVAGEGPNCQARADVFSSSDGATWTTVTTNAGFAGRDWHGLAVLGDRLWVAGGTGRNSACVPVALDDVWSSADGATWQRESQGAFPARAGHGFAVAEGHLFVVGGTDSWPFASRADVWSSADGVHWCEAVADAPFGKRFGHALVVLGGRLVVVAGAGGRMLADAWASD